MSDFLQNGFVRVAQLRSRAGCPIDTHRAGLFGDAVDTDMVSRVAARVSLESLRTPAVISQPGREPDVLRSLSVGLSQLNAQI